MNNWEVDEHEQWGKKGILDFLKSYRVTCAVELLELFQTNPNICDVRYLTYNRHIKNLLSTHYVRYPLFNIIY